MLCLTTDHLCLDCHSWMDHCKWHYDLELQSAIIRKGINRYQWWVHVITLIHVYTTVLLIRSLTNRHTLCHLCLCNENYLYSMYGLDTGLFTLVSSTLNSTTENQVLQKTSSSKPPLAHILLKFKRPLPISTVSNPEHHKSCTSSLAFLPWSLVTNHAKQH